VGTGDADRGGHPAYAGPVRRQHAGHDGRRHRLRRAGTIDLPTPNIIRLFVGAARAVPPASDSELATICQLEITVDDMSPQLWELVIATLFEAGPWTSISRR
jgi:hypothetical protein